MTWPEYRQEPLQFNLHTDDFIIYLSLISPSSLDHLFIRHLMIKLAACMRDWCGSCLWTRLYFIFLVNSLAGSGNWFLKLIKLRENYAGIKWAENSSSGLPNILLKFCLEKKLSFQVWRQRKKIFIFKEIEINVHK